MFSPREIFLKQVLSPNQSSMEIFHLVGANGQDSACLTWAQLDKNARAIAQQLTSCYSVKKGDRVLLVYPPSLDFVEALLGCLYAGIIAVPIAPPDPLHMDPTLLNKVVADCQPVFILTNSHYNLARKAGKLKSFLQLRTAQMPDIPWLVPNKSSKNDFDPMAVQADETALLQYTSGSTSAPKGVCITWDNLIHQAQFNRKELGLSAKSRLVMWVPHFHDFGLIGGILNSIYGNGRLWIISPLDFIKNPSLWMEVMHSVKATHTAAPNFAYSLITKKTSSRQRQQWDLSKLQVYMSAAEPIQATTVDDFIQAFKCTGLKPGAFCPAYGLAEHTVGVTVAGKQRISINRHQLLKKQVEPVAVDTLQAHTYIGCGKVPNDVRLAIVNTDTGQRCANKEIGEIWVDSPSKGAGYWGMQELSKDTFNANITNDLADARGYLRTGDLGFLYQGELFITGRLKDMIIINGENIYPQDIELAVEQSHPQIRGGCVIAFSTEDDDLPLMHVAVEIRDQASFFPNKNNIINAILSMVWKKEAIKLTSIVFLAKGDIPKTTSGKVQRQACKTLFERQQLSHLFWWRNETIPNSECSTAEVLEKEEHDNQSFSDIVDSQFLSVRNRDELTIWLQLRISQLLNLPLSKVSAETPLYQYGLDSLSSIQIIAELEKCLGFSISPSLFFEQENILSTSTFLAEGLTTDVNQITAKISDLYPQSEQQLAPSFNERWVYQMSTSHLSSAYNMPFFLSIKKHIDVKSLENAIYDLVKKHETLRSAFVFNQHKIKRVVTDEVNTHFSVYDFSVLTDEAKTIEVNKHIAVLNKTHFDFEEPGLFVFELMKLAENEYLFAINIHHIITDFHSILNIVRQLFGFKKELISDELSAEINYKAYIDEENVKFSSNDFIKERLYWESVLKNDKHYTFAGNYCEDENRCSERRINIPAGTTENIKQFAKDNDMHLGSLLLNLYQLSLLLVTGRDSILLRLPFSNRQSVASKTMLAYLAHGVPCYIEVNDGLSLKRIFLENKVTLAEQGYFYNFPLESYLHNEGSSASPPVFEYNFINTTNVFDENIQLLSSSYMQKDMWSSQYYSIDFSLTNLLHYGELNASVCYRNKVVSKSFLSTFVAVYLQVLDKFIDNADVSLKDFRLLFAEIIAGETCTDEH
ncbi:AMP-binding protein [Thalassomonas viridans]|uniref:AMP-binding protein n=1 Tax=Thalassomonas viridans TaxID=137584 RepID=A0AAE9Z4P1_9GAMM|nr:fatty acyl-AMP ligase [Thalassomonas viridans]WDE05979.1 AMP-binding protein [Thalassomonas viridans]